MLDGMLDGMFDELFDEYRLASPLSRWNGGEGRIIPAGITHRYPYIRYFDKAAFGLHIQVFWSGV
jgi:hypothetical protein